MCVQRPPYKYCAELYSIFKKALEDGITSRVIPDYDNGDLKTDLVRLNSTECDLTFLQISKRVFEIMRNKCLEDTLADIGVIQWGKDFLKVHPLSDKMNGSN
ncbi:hypothetical protein L2E82_29582 [Cichorium intybus]|uniref:Uncharacterized protein n=1 Tax=Cichorium intybus TaxID=13427 RepID=A0ACB9CXY1_CICIN|nr:hypothetical protein L2E82_29582 [Cichorium intybus]